MISLKCHNRKELQRLINSEEFTKFPFLPITKHRAISHLENPRADEEDTLLILAFEDGKFAGYLGILPDFIFHKDTKTKVGWLSTMFVHPDFRGKKIGQIMLAKACEMYKDNILITEFTPEAETMYNKSNFFMKPPLLHGFVYYYRSNLAHILPEKKKFWQHWKFFLKTTDKIFNSIYYLIPKNRVTNDHFEISPVLDYETKVFLQKNENKNSFNRNVKELDWIVNYPWVINENKVTKSTVNYQFSDTAKSFETIFIKIYNDKKVLENVLVLTMRNKMAKLHYYYYGATEKSKNCAKILHQYLNQSKCIGLISFDKLINQALSKEIFMYKKDKNRKYLMSKILRKSLGSDFQFVVSSGDADCIFT